MGKNERTCGETSTASSSSSNSVPSAGKLNVFIIVIKQFPHLNPLPQPRRFSRPRKARPPQPPRFLRHQPTVQAHSHPLLRPEAVSSASSSSSSEPTTVIGSSSSEARVLPARRVRHLLPTRRRKIKNCKKNDAWYYMNFQNHKDLFWGNRLKIQYGMF